MTTRKSKINRHQDRRLPMIDFQRRVIDFRGDQELFKIVTVLITNRVDLGRVDLGPVPGTGQSGESGQDHDLEVVDLDALPASDVAPSPDEAAPVPVWRQWRKLSDQFGLYRHPDRYGAP